MKPFFLCSSEDLPEAQQAHTLTRNILPGQKKAFVLNGKNVVVQTTDTQKRILVFAGTRGFHTVPIRRQDLRRGIVARTPTLPYPEAFTPDAAKVVTNLETPAPAPLAGATLARPYAGQHEYVVRVDTGKYDSMGHPGNTSWYSEDHKTVLTWWGGGRYGLTPQFWYDLEEDVQSQPVSWSAVNAASSHDDQSLCKALDGTLPRAMDPDDGYAYTSYAGERPEGPGMKYGLWRNGVLHDIMAPGAAHCERVFTLDDGSEVTTTLSLVLEPHFLGIVGATALLRQRCRDTAHSELDNVDVLVSLPDGIRTTASSEVLFNGFLVATPPPDSTPYTCYGHFSPDAKNLMIYGTHDADLGGYTGSAFTLVLPTTPLTHSMDPLLLVRSVQSTSTCTTTVATQPSAVPSGLVSETSPVTLGPVVETHGLWTYRRFYEYAYFHLDELTLQNVLTDVAEQRIHREQVDERLVPTVDWSLESSLRYLHERFTYTNERTYGLAQWRSTGTRKDLWVNVYGAASFSEFQGEAPMDWGKQVTASAYDTYGAALAAQAGYSFQIIKQYLDYSRDLKAFVHLPTSNAAGNFAYEITGPGTSLLLTKAELAAYLGDPGGDYGGAHPYFVVTSVGHKIHTCSTLGDGVLRALQHYLTSAQYVGGTVNIPILKQDKITSGGSLTFTRGVVYSGALTKDTSRGRTLKEATASVAYVTEHSGFSVQNAPTTPYYHGTHTQTIEMVGDTLGLNLNTSQPAQVSVTVTPVTSAVLLADSRWPVSVLATVKPLVLQGEFQKYYLASYVTGNPVPEEILFDENDAPAIMGTVGDGVLDMGVPDYHTGLSFATSPNYDELLSDFQNSAVWAADMLESLPPIDFWEDWSGDGVAPSCTGFEHWFQYSLSPAPYEEQLLFGLDYEDPTWPQGFGERPSLWTREEKFAVAVQGVYGDDVFYNSPVFTGWCDPEKL